MQQVGHDGRVAAGELSQTAGSNERAAFAQPGGATLQFNLDNPLLDLLAHTHL